MDDIFTCTVSTTLQQRLLFSQADHPEWDAKRHLIKFLSKENEGDIQDIADLYETDPLSLFRAWMADNMTGVNALLAEKERRNRQSGIFRG